MAKQVSTIIDRANYPLHLYKAGDTWILENVIGGTLFESYTTAKMREFLKTHSAMLGEMIHHCRWTWEADCQNNR